MKIVELVSGLTTVISNEEQKFLEDHAEARITSLDDRENWIAQNLVRKGLYSISKDNNTLLKNFK